MSLGRRDRHPWTRALDASPDPSAVDHVARCRACAQRVAAVRAAADDTRATLPAPPSDLARRVLAAAAAERAAQAGAARRRARRSRLRLVPRLAAVGAVVLTVGVWGPSVSPLRPPAVAAAVPVGPLPVDCRSADRDRLEVAGVWSGAEADAFARVLQRFERQSGVPVVYHYETRDIAAKLRARIDRGCPPDVALLPHPGLVRDLARQDAIRPLSPSTAEMARVAYGPTWRRMARVRGEQYGVWFKASDKSMLWLRPAALVAAGVESPPATWRELRSAARRLHAAGIDPLAVAGADGWTLTDWFENVLLSEAGPARYEALARHEIPWTHPDVVRSLRRLARLLGDETIVGSPATVLSTDFEASVERALGPAADAAMVYEGDFVDTFLQRTGADPRRGVAHVDFPAVGDRPGRGRVVGGDVAVRFARSADARRLMRFLAAPQAAEAWAARGGFVSPNRLVAPSAYRDRLTREVALRLSRARSVRFDLSDLQPAAFGSTAGQGMWGLFRELARRPGAVDEIARRLERAAAAAHRRGR